MVRYDSYKDSGVKWIGKIPSDWGFNKVGNNTYVKGRIGWKGLKSEDFINEGPFLITGTDFNQDGTISWDKMYHVSQERYDEDPFIQLQDDDVLITKDGTIGKVAYVGNLKGQTCLNSGIFLIRPTKNEYLSRFIFWILKSNIFELFVDFNSGGSTIQHLYQNVFVNFKFPIPPISEQNQIVTYLDKKSSLIDTLIETTQRKIDLLKEKRIALINHVVTKGLNPNVEMKDSGVEWIGEIPHAWKVIQLKYVSEIAASNVDKHIFPNEIQVKLCNYTDVYYNEFIDSKTELMNGSCNKNEYQKFYLKKGYVVITKDSESPTDIGIPALITEDLENIVCGYHLTLIKPMSILGGFVFRFIQSYRTRCYFEVNSNGITRFGLGKSSIENLIIPIPPLSEQHKIIKYIEEQTQIIDTTINKEQKRIELLKEYRQSLISEVVTGKIKVTTYD